MRTRAGAPARGAGHGGGAVRDFRAELRVVLQQRLDAYRMPGTARLMAGMIAAAGESGGVSGAYERYVARFMPAMFASALRG